MIPSVPDKIVKIDFSEAAPPPGYDIVIGQGNSVEAASLISARLGKRQCVIISDSNVAPLYAKRIAEVLSVGGHDVLKTLVFPAGEASKNFSQIESLVNDLLALGVDRKTLIVALGGGVTGDIAGFTASIVLRGIDFVQIPTTLLAQVDSSVGGKTGVDTAHGKNMIGTFYRQRLVLIDVTMLDTLPDREMRAGYAEVIKYGAILDRAFFDWCLAHGKDLLDGDRDAQVYAIEYCCKAKADIVSADEREAGKRSLLNLGHTFGHALESATGFGSKLIHGEAVAIGTLMALRMGIRMGLCPQKDYDDTFAHFKAIGLPTQPPRLAYDIDKLMEFMAADKKAEKGKITLILPHGLGHAAIHKNADAREIRALWEDMLADYPVAPKTK